MCLLRVSVVALLLALVWFEGIASAAADIDERLDELLAPWQGTDSPGLVVAAWQDGRVLFERAYATANLEHDVPIRVDTRFNAGSVAKMFTA